MTLRKVDDQTVSAEAVERLYREMRVFSAGRGKPTLQEFLDAAAATLASEGQYLLHDPETLPVRLRATFERPRPELLSGPALDLELAEHLVGTFYRISDDHAEAMGRKPTLAELLATCLACFRFPAEFFSGVDRTRLVSLSSA